MGVVPGGECVAPFVRLLVDVWGMYSTWRVPLSPRPLQPGGLLARGGRALPPRCLGAEGSAIDACFGRLPSHILWSPEEFMGLEGTRYLWMADGARRSSI